MGKEWLIFVPGIEDLIEGKETIVTIRDLSPGRKKYNAKVVKAILSRNPEEFPEADILWVRSWIGTLYQRPWAIKIIEEAGDYIHGSPHGETLGSISDL